MDWIGWLLDDPRAVVLAGVFALAVHFLVSPIARLLSRIYTPFREWSRKHEARHEARIDRLAGDSTFLIIAYIQAAATIQCTIAAMVGILLLGVIDVLLPGYVLNDLAARLLTLILVLGYMAGILFSLSQLTLLREARRRYIQRRSALPQPER